MEKNVGPETVLKIEGADGNLKLSADYAGADLSAGAFIQTSPAQLCAALAKLIPGDSTAEHVALSVVQGALELALKGL